MTSEELAWKIKRHGVEMTYLSRGSHIGSILSVADIVAVLYADILTYDAFDPDWEDRDRLIMSKGHAGAAIYAALAECGFFPVEELKSHYQNGSRLSGHVSHQIPGVEFSTGSLGHGLSVAAGMALAAKMDGKKHHIYAILGDGECDEGSVWEAALFARQFALDNLTAIIDCNGMQSLDYCKNTLDLQPFSLKWEAFGWDVYQVDGHNHESLKKYYLQTKKESSKPSVILAETVKGRGVPFMENDILWHYRFPHDGWEYDGAVNALFQDKPAGAQDPYTPFGIERPSRRDNDTESGSDHTMTGSWRPGKWVGTKR